MLTGGVARADEAGPAGALDVRARVVILPMVVNAVGEQAYLRSGLSDMLASRLGQHPGVAVMRLEDVATATTDPATAAATALEAGASYVVFGSFTRFGEGASLDVQCLEAAVWDEDDAPEARRVFIQSGSVGEIIPKLDKTAGKIASYVSEPEPALPPVASAPSGPGGSAEPASVAAPPAAPAAAPAPSEAEVADLRRRLEAIESYLFGSTTDGDVPDTDVSPDASQDFGLR